MNILCTHINWDTSSDDEGACKPPRLPKSMVLEVADLRDNEDQDTLVDELADALSDATGFCVSGFCHRILKKPVFAVVKGNQYWDGKDWTKDKHYAKVYQQIGVARNTYAKVRGTCAVSLINGQLVY